MKKVSTLIVGALLLSSTSVFACVNGTEFRGTYSNTTYCMSNITMNWWSAFAWCQAQGYTLVSFERACTDATALTLSTNDYKIECRNVGDGSGVTRTSNNTVWLSRAWEEDKALVLWGAKCGTPCTKSVNTEQRTKKFRALCIE